MNLDGALATFERLLLREGYRPRTIESYLSHVRLHLSNIDLDSLTMDVLDEVKLRLREKYSCGNSIAVAISAINRFCTDVLKRDDLHLKIPRLKRNRNTDVLTHGQVMSIVECVGDDRLFKAVLLTMYHCALRVGEVCNLNLDDINFTTVTVTVRDAKTGTHVINISETAVQSIREYLPYRVCGSDAKALFVSKRNRKRVSRSYVRKRLKVYAVKAGIKQRVYPHILRASCITYMLNQGVNPKVVQKHARHSRWGSTDVYNRPTQSEIKEQYHAIFTQKSDLSDEDRLRVLVDKLIRGEISQEIFEMTCSNLLPKSRSRSGDVAYQ